MHSVSLDCLAPELGLVVGTWFSGSTQYATAAIECNDCDAFKGSHVLPKRNFLVNDIFFLFFGFGFQDGEGAVLRCGFGRD